MANALVAFANKREFIGDNIDILNTGELAAVGMPCKVFFSRRLANKKEAHLQKDSIEKASL